MSDENALPEDSESARVSQLKARIAAKKNELRVLQTDFETPRLLQDDIATWENKLSTFIVEAVRVARNMRKQLNAKQHRQTNLKDMLISAGEELDAMNAELKRIQNADRIERLRAIAAEMRAMGVTHLDIEAAETD